MVFRDFKKKKQKKQHIISTENYTYLFIIRALEKLMRVQRQRFCGVLRVAAGGWVPAWSQPGTRRESIEVNKSSKVCCSFCPTKDTKEEEKKALWSIWTPKRMAGQVDLK